MNLILLDFKINDVIIQTHPLHTSCVSAATGQPITGGDLSRQEGNRLLKGTYIRLAAWWLGSKVLTSFVLWLWHLTSSGVTLSDTGVVSGTWWRVLGAITLAPVGMVAALFSTCVLVTMVTCWSGFVINRADVPVVGN